MTYFALPLSIIEKTKHIHALDVDLLQYKYRKPRLVQMPEAATDVFCAKGYSLNFRKISRKHRCQRKHFWTLQNF